MKQSKIQRIPAEHLYAEELEKLRRNDLAPIPAGWKMSPIAIEKFVLGDKKQSITRKFVGEKALITRIIVALATNRGAMLVGEPGTAKSWLSELLAAAISGSSVLTIQGGAITNVNQLLYSWNEALVKSTGPTLDALIPGPLYQAMKKGEIVRFEEIVRCPQPYQDAVLSVLSERLLVIPELSRSEGKNILFAREGFNIIATANTRDQNVNKMSSALKRRMNFETIQPIQSVEDEISIVHEEAARLLKSAGISTNLDKKIIMMLVTIFHELRNGQSLDGRSTDRLAATAMSTAEAVTVVHAMGIHAHYYHNGKMRPQDLVDFLLGAALKDNPDDRRRMRHYFDTEIATKKGSYWRALYERRSLF